MAGLNLLMDTFQTQSWFSFPDVEKYVKHIPIRRIEL